MTLCGPAASWVFHKQQEHAARLLQMLVLGPGDMVRPASRRALLQPCPTGTRLPAAAMTSGANLQQAQACKATKEPLLYVLLWRKLIGGQSSCGLLAFCVLLHTQCVQWVVSVHYKGQQPQMKQPAGFTLKGVEMQCSTMRSWRPVPWCTAMASS